MLQESYGYFLLGTRARVIDVSQKGMPRDGQTFVELSQNHLDGSRWIGRMSGRLARDGDIFRPIATDSAR